MGKRISKILQKLFFFEKTEFKTKLSKHEINKRIGRFLQTEREDYNGFITDEGFFVAEKHIKHYAIGVLGTRKKQNSFAPRLKATITQDDKYTTVQFVLRMNILMYFLWMPIYLIFMFTVLMFPLVYLFMYFAFIRPANRLREQLEDLLIQ